MKRILSFLICISMLFSMLVFVSGNVSADDKTQNLFSCTYSKTNINGTDCIVATPSLSKNSGFASIEMKLHFNTEKLTVVTAVVASDYPNPIGKFRTGEDRVTKEPIYSSALSLFNIGEAGIDLSKVTFVKLVAATGICESETDGNLFDAYFTLKDGYKPDDITASDFSLEIELFADINGKGIAYTVVTDTASEPTKEPEKVDEYIFPFTDVADDMWYRKDVENAHRLGLINGKSETEYKPSDNMTYAEAVKLACAMNQLYYDNKVTLTNGDDVWYSTYMDYAKDKGIITQDLSAVADTKITRRDFVKIFYKAIDKDEYKQINDIAADTIPDVKMGDDGADEIYTFYRSGILTGSDDDGTFYAHSNITRAQVAAILTRMFDSNARILL